MYLRFTNQFLAENEINCGRQNELDLARAVLIFCLALIHCTIECTNESEITQGIPYLFDTVIGGPFSAPMYMFVMGAGMAYTRRNTPKHHMERGVRILAAGYLLNICRFLVPYLIGYALTGDREKYIAPLLYKVLGNDILIFAGLAMMILAMFIKLKISTTGMLAIGILLSILGTYLNGVDVHSPLRNIFLGYFIGTEDAAGMVVSDFPICNWLLFPIGGYVFGTILKRVKDKRRFYLTFSLPALIFAIVYCAYGIRNELGMFGEGQNCYYHMVVCDVIASLALTVGMIGVYYAVSVVLPQKIMQLARLISVNITAVYCIHWVLLAFFVNVLLYAARGSQELPIWMVLLLGTAISIVSIVIAHYFRVWRERSKKHEKIS